MFFIERIGIETTIFQENAIILEHILQNIFRFLNQQLFRHELVLNMTVLREKFLDDKILIFQKFIWHERSTLQLTVDAFLFNKFFNYHKYVAFFDIIFFGH